MNINYWLKKIFSKATCQLSKGATLGSTASIQNARGIDSCIRIGMNSFIAGEIFVFAHGGEIELGDWCFVGEGAKVWSALKISIGNRVLISHNVNIFDSLTHPISATKRHLQFKAIMQQGHPRNIDLNERPVEIGDDVWIGANSCILSGVNIGAGAIVGAGSVVTKDIAPHTIVAGNPARLIRELRDDER